MTQTESVLCVFTGFMHDDVHAWWVTSSTWACDWNRNFDQCDELHQPSRLVFGPYPPETVTQLCDIIALGGRFLFSTVMLQTWKTNFKIYIPRLRTKRCVSMHVIKTLSPRGCYGKYCISLPKRIHENGLTCSKLSCCCRVWHFPQCQWYWNIHQGCFRPFVTTQRSRSI